MIARWKRQSALNRILKRLQADSDLSATERKLELIAAFSSDHIARVDSYQRNYYMYQPHLPLNMSQYHDVEEREAWLNQIETLTPRLKKIIDFRVPTPDPGFKYFMQGMEAVLYHVATFALIEGSREPVTVEQQDALMEVSVILNLDDDRFVPKFAEWEGPSSLTIEEWLTRRIIANPTDADEHVRAYRERLERAANLPSGLKYKTDSLCDASDDLIQKLVAINTSSSTADLRMTTEIYHRLYEGISMEALAEMLYFLPLGKMDPEDSMVLIKGLHNYDQLPQYENFSTADERTLVRCHALLVVTMALLEARLQPTIKQGRIANNELANMVCRMPERAEAIADAIRARQSDDVGIIDAVISSPSSALSDGAL